MKALVWYGNYLKKHGAYEKYVKSFKSSAAPAQASEESLNRNSYGYFLSIV